MQSRLKVASVSRVMPTPVDPSGGIFIQNRLRAMEKIMDLSVLQPIPYFPGLKPLPDWVPSDEGNVQRVPMFYIPKLVKFLDSFWLQRAVENHIEHLHERINLEVLDAHFGYPDGVACQKIGAKLDIPTFVTIRGVENEQLHQQMIGHQLRKSLQRVQGCICVSHFLADVIRQNGVPEEKIGVVHNSVEREIFFPGSMDQAREKLGIEPGRCLITSVGHLVNRKRHHLLLRAVANLCKANNDLQVVIIGSDHQDKKYALDLHKLRNELGLNEQVFFLGNLPPEEVSQWLRASNAFALFSAREGCCNAILEALACGLPVVATDVGDNSWFIRNDINGYIVPVDDLTASSRALEQVVRKLPWKKSDIAQSLPVGDWGDVALKVDDFMRRKLAGTRAGVSEARR